MTDERICERAAEIIMSGGTPRSVALQFPAWFVNNHDGIVRLWEVINRRTWRFKDEGRKPQYQREIARAST